MSVIPCMRDALTDILWRNEIHPRFWPNFRRLTEIDDEFLIRLRTVQNFKAAREEIETLQINENPA